MNLWHITFWLVLTWLACGLPAAAQTTLCIESTSALYQAVGEMPQRSGEVRLRLISGTFTLGSLLQSELAYAVGPRGRLTIEGGYTAGCTQRSNDPAATTLRSAAGSGDKRVRIEIGDESLVLENLSLQGLDLEVVDTDPFNPSDYGRCTIAGRNVLLRRVRALDTYVLLDLACHNSRIENSLISSRSGTPSDTVLRHRIVNPYIVEPEGFGSLSIVYSTILGGAVRYNACCHLGGAPPGRAYIANSVFDNDNIELQLDADVVVSHNRYDSSSFTGGSVITNLGNISQPPALQASGVPQVGSPLVNAGTRFVDGQPGVDLAHSARIVGTHPDIGAYETPADNRLYLDVSNTASSGSGSLAAALAAANGFNGGQVIRFNIPGACPRVITLSQTLTVTDDLEIDGTTQPGSEPNSFGLGFNGRPCVVLAAGSGVSDGLVFNSQETADQLTLRGLGFSGFSSDAVWIRSGSGHLLAGNQFGGRIETTTLVDVGTAIRTSDSARAVQIGGASVDLANLIGNANFGISLAGAGGHRVIGNAIGDAGFRPLPNAVGISVLSPNNRIEDNLIAQSLVHNLLLSGESAQFNVITNNPILAATGSQGNGVSIQSGANRNRIGPDNHFLGNSGDGIRIVSGSFNDLSGNTFQNQGGLAIDLGVNGVTPNDDDPILDGNTSANREQNFPVLTLARRRQVAPFVWLDVEGSLRTTEGTYRIDFYRSDLCDGSGHGEGADWLGTTTVEVDCLFPVNNQCLEDFALTVPGLAVSVGDAITATATSPGRHTSEFSACMTVSSTIVVLPQIFADGFE